MASLIQLLVFPRTVTVRFAHGRPLPLAWLPAIIVLIDILVALYVAATGTVIRVPAFNLATSLVTILCTVTLFYLGVRMSRANH